MSKLSLNLRDLAFAAERDLGGVSEEGRAVIATILREDPRFADQFAQLEAMAGDADVDNVLDGFEAHRRFEILLSEEWEHPADVLEEGPRDVWYEPLLNLATTLSDRVEGSEDSAKFLAVERRLERAYALHRTEEDAYGRLVKRLDELDLEAAERTLQQLSKHVRFRRRKELGE